jgi:tRNA G18 (ribose-2'-O)-methylase SpoU
VPILSIDDPRDIQLAAYRNVSDHDLLVEHGLFAAEGRLVVRRLLESNRFPTRSVMVTEAALAPLRDAVDANPYLPVYVVPQEVMDGITGFNMHRGCLALGERPQPAVWRDVAAEAQRLLVLERVSNADNVGALFRNAAAFGVDAVLLERTCIDPMYRKAIRTSMGASLTMPFATIEPWPAVLHDLARDGWSIIAMTPAPQSPAFRDVVPALAGTRVAVVVGHEGDGVSAEALDACTHQARIPMTPGVDSLNVATAAAIALYELTRSKRRARTQSSKRRQ